MRFVQTHVRAPLHGEGRDIFERLYAVRLDQLRQLPEAKALLGAMDSHRLLAGAALAARGVDGMDADAVLAELGIGNQPADNNIAVLRNVRPYAEIKAAEEIANRTPCTDFDSFKPLFEVASSRLKMGTWVSQPFAKNASIELGGWFVIGGQIAFVAEMLARTVTKDGRDNPRMRVIFDNHTESNLLLRSLAHSLYPEANTPVGRRLIRKDDGLLFGSAAVAEDIESGTITSVEYSRDTAQLVSISRGMTTADESRP